MTTETVFSIESNGQKFFQAVLSPDSKGIFSDQLDSLLQKYDSLCSSLETDSDNLLLAKVFLSDYTNQKDDIDVHPLFTDRFSSCGLTIIGQPPLNGFKINVLLWFIKGKSMVKYRKEDAFYAHIDGNLHIFQSIRNDKKGTNLEKNTQLLFEKYNQLLREHGMSVRDNCVRTWLFVRDIDKEYIDVVKGRNNFFSANGLTKDSHFITSTGIEGSIWNSNLSINIDFYSIKGIDTTKIQYLNALDWLNPTHEYGVAFERGVSYTLSGWRYILLSGTASIDKYGRIVHSGDVIAQLKRIFVNIEQLLKNGNATISNLSHLIIYLRDSSDYKYVNNYIRQHYHSIPSVIVYGKVCRPGWLIEIECMAICRE